MEMPNQYFCVCQLCSCGSHHCPIKNSSNNKNYHYQHDIGSSSSFLDLKKDSHFQFHSLPQARSPLSIYKSDYLGYQYPQPKYNYEFDSLKKTRISPTIPFIGSTTYQDEFRPIQKSFYHLKTSLDHGNYLPPISNNLPSFQQRSTYDSHYQHFPNRYLKRTQDQLANDIKNSRLKTLNPEDISSSKYKNQLSKFCDDTTYKSSYKKFEELPKISSLNYRCQVQKLPVPLYNYVNNGKHIYYDWVKKRFI